ncbi:hypothetical protein VD659_07835 [Herbiconiux sp. 11R-BC]|uniref:hypothetical protein n=1 Tax=Herbiconiux sp. 11R-BC TaxID=3111637 RepID=UPI003BFFF4A9
MTRDDVTAAEATADETGRAEREGEQGPSDGSESGSGPGPEAMAQIVDSLYALAPGAFVAARNARAAAAAEGGDRDLARRIRTLTRPSVAAWAVNMLARHRAEQLDALLDLGERMRTAQDSHDGALVRDLGRERHRLLSGAAATARELGDELGVAVSASAAVEVQQTLQAAFGDRAAATAVRSGALLRTLESSGLEPVDLDGATAVPLDVVTESTFALSDAETSSRATPSRGGRSSTGDRNSPRTTTTTSKAVGAGGGPRTSGTPDGGVRARKAGGNEAAEQKAAKQKSADLAAVERAAREQQARDDARRDAEDTRQDAEDAAAEVAGIELRMRDNTALRDRLADEVRALRDELDAAQDELSSATSARAALRKELAAATRASDAAARTAARARARLDRFDRLP